MKTTSVRTREEKQTILNRIDALRKEGKSLTAAAKDQGVTVGNVYAWRSSLNTRGSSRRVARPNVIQNEARDLDSFTMKDLYTVAKFIDAIQSQNPSHN